MDGRDVCGVVDVLGFGERSYLTTWRGRSQVGASKTRIGSRQCAQHLARAAEGAADIQPDVDNQRLRVVDLGSQVEDRFVLKAGRVKEGRRKYDHPSPRCRVICSA